MSRLLAGFLLLSAFFSTAALADEPTFVMLHSGRLFDGADQPVNDGAMNFVFRLYKLSAPNETEEPLWTGAYLGKVARGLYTVSLGSGASKLPVSLFPPDEERYLEITVNSVTLLPRLRVGAMPNAANAANLGGRAAADYALKSDLYTKTEIDAIVDVRATGQVNALSAAVDTKLALKADASAVYSKTAADLALALKADASAVYPKTAVDSALALKADAASAVSLTGSYANPTWLASLAASKITGSLPLFGDVTGSSGAAVVNALQGFPLSPTTPTGRQVLTWNGGQWAPASRSVPVTLADTSSVAVDASKGNVFDLTLGGNRAIANPTNLANGETYIFRIRQDGTGGRTITWGTSFVFEGSASSIPAQPNALGITQFVSDGSNLYAIGRYNVQSLASSTGGVITTSGGARIHTFTSSGSFVASGAGTVEVLVVAGGGSGANSNTTNGNGGGGGGGVIHNLSFPVAAGSYAVTVGSGGVAIGNATAANGNDGGSSTFGSLVALGGGGGGSSATSLNGRNGGSGGGGAYSNGRGGLATQGGGFGYSGGRAWGSLTGGGGGGAGSAGIDGTNDNAPSGNGGTGYATTISGSLQYYAGGGGGGGNSSERAGDGFDGGGRGCGTTTYYQYNSYPVGVNAFTRGSSTPHALPNTGGGGGAGSYWSTNGNWTSGTSGAGGSGIVIVRYVP